MFHCCAHNNAVAVARQPATDSNNYVDRRNTYGAATEMDATEWLVESIVPRKRDTAGEHDGAA